MIRVSHVISFQWFTPIIINRIRVFHFFFQFCRFVFVFCFTLFVFVLCLLCQMLSVSLDCPFLIAFPFSVTYIWFTLYSMTKHIGGVIVSVLASSTTKTGWLKIKIKCPSGATCLPADSCFSDVALFKSN
jgi:hypothetical protein